MTIDDLLTRAMIEAERAELINVARPDSPVPDSVRYTAQTLCHALSWVLGETPHRPYHTISACCCIGVDLSKRPLQSVCMLGPNKCLCPSNLPTEGA